MKLHHFNQTNDPVRYRTWILARETMGEDDLTWLKAFDIPIKVDQPKHTFDTSTGGTHSVYGKPLYTVETTTDKQRDMLVLKYGNCAVLLCEEVVLPNSMSTCELKGITW